MNFDRDFIDYKDSTVQYLAVLYPRVSDPQQINQGSGLHSQETRLREYARFLSIPVAEVFREEGWSGEILNRPEMLKLLDFISTPPSNSRYVVIIDEISRLARDYRVHFDLRDAIEERGALLDSPTTNFKAVRNADSDYVEGIQALGAEHFRKKNAETARNRKWARLKEGYWPYKAPIGYKYKMTKGHGNLLVRDEPQASILTEAFEGYASSRFATQTEVKRFLENHPDFAGKSNNGTVTVDRVTKLITNPIYAGYVQCAKLDIAQKRGKHEPLISVSTFEKMAERRSGCAVAPARRDLNLDFRLRGFVDCADCGKPLRSCWSTGEYKRYPYYLCQTKDCASYGKSIKREKIEGEFTALLQSVRPSTQLFTLVKALIENAWTQRTQQTQKTTKSLRRKMRKIEKDIDSFLDRIVDAESSTAIRAYERKIGKLEQEKQLTSESLEKQQKVTRGASSWLELPMKLLANPCILWESGDYWLQRLVLRLVFSEPLSYCRNEGYRTAKTTLPINVLRVFEGDNSKMVRSRRLELPPVLPDSDLNAARLPIPPRPQKFQLPIARQRALV